MNALWVNRVVRIATVLVLGAGIAWMLAHRQEFDVQAFEAWIRSQGLWAPLAFMASYAVGTVLFLPGSVMSLVGGAAFGPVWGTLLNLTGATLGALLAFLIARYVASDFVTARSGKRLKHLIHGVEAEGWRFVAFVRLVPLFPFNLLNYALGLTHIRLSHYFLATYVCMIPAAVAYTYLGYAGREALAGGEGVVQKALLAVALVAVALFLPRLIRRLRGPDVVTVDEVKRCMDEGRPIMVLDVRDHRDFRGPQGHLPGALNVPLQNLRQQMVHMKVPADCPVMVISYSDRGAAMAVEVLSRGGLDARVIKGGLTQWHSEGWAVERS